MLSHGDDSHAYPALVRLHAGHEGPGVSLGVVHLHRGEVLHAIVATDGPKSVHICHQGYPAASHVHAADVVPSVRNTVDQLTQSVHEPDLRVGDGVEALHGPEEGGTIVAPTGVDLTIECGHPQSAPLAQHGDRLAPHPGLGVEQLHAVEDGEPVVTAQGVDLAEELDDPGC